MSFLPCGSLGRGRPNQRLSPDHQSVRPQIEDPVLALQPGYQLLRGGSPSGVLCWETGISDFEKKKKEIKEGRKKGREGGRRRKEGNRQQRDPKTFSLCVALAERQANVLQKVTRHDAQGSWHAVKQWSAATKHRSFGFCCSHFSGL